MLAELVGKTVTIESVLQSGRYEVLAFEDGMLKLQQVTRFLKTEPFWFPVGKIDRIEVGK
ncbi:hypothetical protein HY493_00010 [Candidatus Woesearchaeota archaeon]|nr:hypothetical protein [Candidatus Woesearchaeota archaeon]